MGNRRLSKRRVKSLTEQNKGATDEWAFVRPPMVPGYSANIRVAALGPMHGFGFEDAADIPADGQTTAVWVREDENSNTIAVTSGDADFTDGAVTLTPRQRRKRHVRLSYACRGFQLRRRQAVVG